MVILVDAHPRHRWLREAIQRRLREELAKIQVVVNEEKTKVVDLSRGESFGNQGRTPEKHSVIICGGSAPVSLQTSLEPHYR
jgi:hypothetical protein